MTTHRARVLSFHASYRCRHSGECCTARWPIPSLSGDPLPLTPRGCVFHDAAAHRCSIHTFLGHDQLPVACQQFPRVSVLDPQGAAITLSCFCPTALAMLDEFDGPIAIVDSTVDAASVEGLDARTSLPPALRPDVLMDWESWWTFERLAVDVFNRDAPLRELLATLSEAIEKIRSWRPGHGALIDVVQGAFNDGGKAACPLTRLPAYPLTGLPAYRRFLACHAFASWPAHLGAGLRTWLRSLETVVFLLEEGWTIRDIDLWLRHFADPRRLARVWSTAESEEPLH